MTNFLKKEKPDLIISVIPLINNVLLTIAQKQNIPFLLLPTDLDATIFIKGIRKPEYQKFAIALPFDDKEILKKIEPAKIPQDQIVITGFPIRPHFFKPKNHKKIKATYAIPEGKPVVLLLFGAQGSHELYTFAQQLTTVKILLHLLLCPGKNKHIQKKMSSLSFPDHITTSIIEFTPHLSDLMAVSDLFITKSGSVSVSEALYMNLPMFLDGTTTILEWEKLNHHFIKKHKLGTTITNYNDIPQLITQFFSDKHYASTFKDNLKNLEKKNASQEIRHCIATLLNEGP